MRQPEFPKQANSLTVLNSLETTLIHTIQWNIFYNLPVMSSSYLDLESDIWYWFMIPKIAI